MGINFAFIDKNELAILTKLKNEFHIRLGSILKDNVDRRFCIIGMKRDENSLLYFLVKELERFEPKCIKKIKIDTLFTIYDIVGFCNKRKLKKYLSANYDSVVYYREIFNTVRKYEAVKVGTLYIPFNNNGSWYELVIEDTEDYIKVLQIDKIYEKVNDIQDYLYKLLQHPQGKELKKSRIILSLNILDYNRMYKKVEQYSEKEIQKLLVKMQLLGVNF